MCCCTMFLIVLHGLKIPPLNSENLPDTQILTAQEISVCISIGSCPVFQ